MSHFSCYYAECHQAECHQAECRGAYFASLSVLKCGYNIPNLFILPLALQQNKLVRSSIESFFILVLYF
jgi:hypothetical protein